MGEKIGSGSQGCVFDLQDTEKPSKTRMAIKFSTNTEKQNEEIQVLKTIRKSYKQNTERAAKSYPIPQIISHGVFKMTFGEITDASVCFYVMKQFDQNLEQYFSTQNTLSTKMVFSIVKKLIDAIQVVHEAGYVYNDIKLENIMIQKSKDDSITDPKIILVDYGMAMRYQDDQGNHLQNKEMSKFCGNLIFASLDVLKFNRPSRKDDLIMLCYFLIYLLNGGDMPLIWDFLGDKENITK